MVKVNMTEVLKEQLNINSALLTENSIADKPSYEVRESLTIIRDLRETTPSGGDKSLELYSPTELRLKIRELELNFRDLELDLAMMEMQRSEVILQYKELSRRNEDLITALNNTSCLICGCTGIKSDD